MWFILYTKSSTSSSSIGCLSLCRPITSARTTGFGPHEGWQSWEIIHWKILMLVFRTWYYSRNCYHHTHLSHQKCTASLFATTATSLGVFTYKFTITSSLVFLSVHRDLHQMSKSRRWNILWMLLNGVFYLIFLAIYLHIQCALEFTNHKLL